MTGPVLSKASMWTTLLLAACAAHADRGLDADLVDRVNTGPPPEPRAVLEKAAGDTDPNPRSRALVLLAAGAATEPQWVARGLYDPDAWVQGAMVHALVARGATQPLAEFAARPAGDADVRADALRAVEGSPEGLCTAHGARSEGPLCLALAERGDAVARERLARDLAERVPFDLDYLADLGRSGLVELVPAVSRVDADDELAVPWAAARAGLGDEAAFGALVRGLRDADEGVRLMALDAAVELPDAVAVRALKKADGRGSPLLRQYAALGLALHGRGGVDVFERALHHDDAEVRRLAVRLAHHLEGARAERVVAEVARRGLVDEDPEVRTRALALANDRGLLLDGQVVRGLLLDDYVDVRVEAAGYVLAHP